jgi:hypothetical protein
VNVFSREGMDVQIAMSNVTLAQNQIDGPLGTIYDLGGLPPEEWYGATVVQLRNTILAQNATASGGDCPLRGPSAATASSGHNLLGDVTGCAGLTPVPSDLIGVNPQFATYGDHGGPVPSLSILATSPAVDGGDPTGCVDAAGNPLTTDQRGMPRPAGPRCDIGAFELQVP